MVELNYGRMMQRAMQGLVAEALGVVADGGLPGEHHFYITFQTAHPGVDIPDWLAEKFPEELVIVLQHEFADLAVTADRFSVTLSFSGRPATLVVPFDAILEFADPSAPFGLRFDPTDGDGSAGDAGEPAGLEADDRKILDRARDESAGSETTEAPASEDGDAASDPGRVVSLDQFRKK